MTLIYSIFILFIAIGFLKRKQYSFLVGTVIAYITYLLFLFMEYKLNFLVKDYITLLVLLSVVGHLLIGEYLDFYIKTQHFDRCLHAFGAFSSSLFLYSIISYITMTTYTSKAYRSIFVISLGISFGVLLEIIEFTLDFLRKKNNQKGLKDTDTDLIFNVIGSTLAGILSFFIIF